MSNFTIEGTVSVNVQEVYHPIISNAFIQFHNIPTDMSPLENDDRFGILEIILHKTKDVYHETHHYKLPVIEDFEIVIKNAMIYDMAHNKWTKSISDEELFPDKKHVFQIRTPKNSTTEMVQAVIYGKVIGRKDEELEEGEIEEELVDSVQELYTVYELPDLIDTMDNTVDPVDLTAYMYLQTALETTCKLTEYKDGIQQYNLNDSDILVIEKFMKKMYKYMISDKYNDQELFDMYDSMEECLESYLEDIKNGKNL